MLDSDVPEGAETTNEREPIETAPASRLARTAGNSPHDPRPAGSDHSLSEDISSAFEDGKTYLEAELAYQKSRAAFAAHEIKAGLGLATLMLAFLHLALMGLVVGLIIALAPVIGAFAAIGLVVGILTVLTGVFAYLAINRFRRVSGAFDHDDPSSETIV